MLDSESGGLRTPEIFYMPRLTINVNPSVPSLKSSPGREVDAGPGDAHPKKALDHLAPRHASKLHRLESR